MAKRYRVTFVGDSRAQDRREPQVSCGPQWPQGLRPGQSVELNEVPDSCYGSKHHQFLVDGQVMERRLAPPRSRRKRTRYARVQRD